MNNDGDYVVGLSRKGSDDSRGVFGRVFVQSPSADITPPVLSAALANDTGVSNADDLTNDPTMAGNVTDSQSGVATLVASVDGGSAIAVAFDQFGHFTFDPGLAPDGTDDGSHRVVFTATDNESNVATTALLFTLDTLAPAAPANVMLTPNTDTGTSNTDGITSNTSPTAEGDAESGSMVTLFVDGRLGARSAYGFVFDQSCHRRI